MRVRRNELKRNAREYTYISGYKRRRRKPERGQREREREGRRDGGKKRGREARQGEILTLEMRELPRVCGVRNFLAIYRRRCGKGKGCEGEVGGS